MLGAKGNAVRSLFFRQLRPITWNLGRGGAAKALQSALPGSNGAVTPWALVHWLWPARAANGSSNRATPLITLPEAEERR